MRLGGLDHREHHRLRFADREAADGVALEVEVDEGAGALDAEVRQVAALHDAEHRLARLLAEGELAALGPAHGQAHRLLDLGALGRQADALVELHLDVGAEQPLDLDGALGAHLIGGAVDMRAEGDAGLVDLPKGREGHHLEAAGIGEDRPVPLHETMQAAEAGHPLGTGAQHQMVGVAQHDVGAELADLARIHRLHGGRGPHGHEGGVRISPGAWRWRRCGRRRPARGG